MVLPRWTGWPGLSGKDMSMYSTPSTPDTRKTWPVRLLLAAHLLVTAAPWLFIAGMAAWAGRAAAILGHWPVPLTDDPKFIATGDQLYGRLGELSDVLGYWLTLSPFILPVLAAVTWRDYRRGTRLWLIGAYVAGLVMIVLDPLGLFAWMAD
jgi:hypothetical protein